MTAPSRKPRVLILSYAFPPDNFAGAARPYRFAKFLQRLGYPVTVIAAGPGARVSQEDNVFRVAGEIYGRPPTNGVSRLVEKAARIVWLPYDEGITWVPRAVALASRWRQETCVLFSTSPPLTTHLAALALQRRYGWKWIADFRDPLTGNPVRCQRRVKWSDRILERVIFSRSDAVIANTDRVLEHWISRSRESAGKFHLVWNGFDPDQILEAAPVPARDYSVLTHTGGMYPQRHPGQLLRTLNRLVKAGEIRPAQLRVRLIGSQSSTYLPDATDFAELTRAGVLEETVERIPPGEVARCLATSDYLLLLDIIAGQTGMQVPSKIFDYIRIGRPILASTTPNSPVERILSESGVPHTCLYPDLGDAERDRRVLEFLRLPNTPVRASETFTTRFDAQHQAEGLADLISGLYSPRTDHAQRVFP